MSFTEWLWRLISNCGLIVRRGHTHGRFPILATYIKIEFKRYFLAQLLGRKMTSESVFGYRIHFYDYETFAILFEEVYVPDVYYFASRTPQPCVIDCGSNIGLAVLYFKKIYPACKITAFEADDVTFKMLEKNVTANGLKDVTLVNKAVYESKGSITFYFAPDRPGSLVGSTRHESLAKSAAKTVETDVLSDYVSGDVDFLKMDIEGAEEKVLKNLLDTNKLHLVKEMVLEYHHHLTPEEDRLGIFLEMLERSRFGYQLKAPLSAPFPRGEFQGMLIYGYRRTDAENGRR
jgi:FkbM family methyltransferase